MNKEIDIFLVKNDFSIADFNLDRLVSVAGESKEKTIYKGASEALKEQLSKLEISGSVQLVNIEEIPLETQARLVAILDENALIEKNYLLSVISLYNMHQTYGAFCGPVVTKSNSKPTEWFVAEIANYYKQYNLNEFSSVLSFDITDEPNNHPNAIGSIFSGRHYNELGGYAPTPSPRGHIRNDSAFLSRVAEIGNILYSKALSSAYYITPSEFNIGIFSTYFYEIGYCRGVQISNDVDGKYDTLWKMFVESPESIDNRTLSFARFNDGIDEDKKKKYAEHLASFKCMYQIGMFEGINGQKIL